ncbi:tetratricopeptide repeat protein [Cohaesibacter haloalkalitolerans]|uniref:tetratricopeptide repeat protein n=1 Tax=Cohaesibacter haloalkalitolerans TaxID=1162980 RepID=UPI0013C40193|nr:tetratricopeptide repeat protein [Cohaesibacter haloalkalitolerans]
MFRQHLLTGVVGFALLMGPATFAGAQTEAPDIPEESVVDALADIPTTLTGTYLSALIAQDEDDLELAAHFYAQALEKDPENPLLLERNFALTLAVGDHERAFALADKMAVQSSHKAAASKEAEDGKAEQDDSAVDAEGLDGRIAPMVHMALGVKALKGRNYSSAAIQFKSGMDVMQNNPAPLLARAPLRRNLNDPRLLSASAQYGPFALISQTVLDAWATIGQDKTKLDDVISLLKADDDSEVNQFFFSLHAGLIAAYAKDYTKAVTLLQQSLDADPNSLATATALVNNLLKAGNNKRASEVIDTFAASAADTEEKEWLQQSFSAMKPIANSIRTPQDGAAEFFSTLGNALTEEGAIEGGALYLQFADYLRPGDDYTEFSLARLFEHINKNEVALAHYDSIKPESAVYRKAQRRAAFVEARLDHPDLAIKRMKTLLEGNYSDLETVSVLSRIYQSEQRYKEAVDTLSRGINSIRTKRDIHWSLYFLRGSAYDQLKDWPNTEKDMQSALKLFPNQPTVLNYLGYSWVDRGIHLDKAIEMIRQAVALRPFDGFFVDSLGWAHYRLKQYEEAVNFLERAVELRPEDPTITDHLGDAYWRVGRKNEATFQWQRVKTMQPDDKLMQSVDDKIAKGLTD